MRAADLATKLPGVKQRGSYYDCCCPAHEDTEPSLSFHDGDVGIMFLCRAGCASKAVTQALAALVYCKVADFFFERNGHKSTTSTPSILSSIYTYTDQKGEVLYQVCKDAAGFKVRRPDPQHSTDWIWNTTGIEKVLYNLPELLEAPVICYVEGEKDVETLRRLGFVATTHPHGAKSFKAEYAKQIKHASPEAVVFVFRDEDPPGITLQKLVLVACHAEGLRVKQIILPDMPALKGADVTDWLAAQHTKAELLAIMETTPDWSPAADDPANDLEPKDQPQRDDEPDEPVAIAPAVHVPLPPGFIQRYVEIAMRRTDAPTEAHVLTAVTILSALAGPQPRLDLAHQSKGVRLLMWSMNLVDSTSGRKTTVNDFGAEVIQAVLGEGAILPWKGSPEAFIQLMAARDGQPCVLTRDEYVGLLLGMKQGGYMATLAQDFIRMWDGLPLTMGRTAKINRNTGQRVNDSDVVRNPYLVQLAAATRSRFIEVATIEDILDGFLARFTFTSGSAEEQRMKRRTPEIEAAWQAVIALAQAFHVRSQYVLTIPVSDEMLELEWQVEKRFKAAALAQARPDVAAPAMKRLAESVFKTAALLALEQAIDGAATITGAHFEAAEELSQRWQTTTLALVADLGRTKFQTDCDDILRTVQHASGDGIPTRALYRVHRRLRKRDFDEILAALDAQNEIIRDTPKTGKKGWQIEVIRATGRRRNA